jgi:hypothetical protein
MLCTIAEIIKGAQHESDKRFRHDLPSEHYADTFAMHFWRTISSQGLSSYMIADHDRGPTTLV